MTQMESAELELREDATNPFELVDTLPSLASTPAISIWTRLRRFVASPLGASIGGVLFALWAAVINRDGGTYVSLRSCFGQFFASSLLTLFDARLMDRLFHGFSSRAAGAWAAATGSLIGTYALVIGVHHAIGTPHILLTILPGVPPTLGFTAMYTLLLLRESSPSAAVTHQRT